MSQRFRVDGDTFDNAPRVDADLFYTEKKDAFSKIPGYVWTGPSCRTLFACLAKPNDCFEIVVDTSREMFKAPSTRIRISLKTHLFYPFWVSVNLYLDQVNIYTYILIYLLIYRFRLVYCIHCI